MANHDSSTDDAELVVLGLELEGAWRAQQQEHAAADPGQDWPVHPKAEQLAQRIESLPARTLAGILAKAVLMAYRRGTWSALEIEEDERATDIGIALAIANDALALARPAD